jgi:phosphoribosylaminoimidazole-succinocarboxamide synthase
MADSAVTSIEIQSLSEKARGKVRNLYTVDQNTLLFVATDRISAYDVTMNNVR